MTRVRVTVAMWLCLLAMLVLQAPPQAVSASEIGAGPSVPSVQAQPQSTPATKTPGPGTQGNAPTRGSSANRQPNGPPRPGQGPGSGSSLIDTLDQGRWRWWDDPQIKTELSLTDATVKSIQSIYAERVQTFRAKWDEFDRERAKLNRMTSAADETMFENQVVRVERLRSELATSRTMMIFRISKLLHPDQVSKLRQIVERRQERDRDRSAGTGQGR